uniref:WD repeat-containing protein 44-like n=1 Tax=Ananas comosus var. bracteatus TaxID=296719 RepID=A0A6V7NRD7_ANACO|nr:unnamed protein product [Ananas comosus var. bracteatus]
MRSSAAELAMAAASAAAAAAEEEEEEFYESLDRILSSSCSSTSASDDEAEHLHHRRRRRSSHHIPPPSPAAAAAAAPFDVWISEPSSVEERRRRLLQQMGLAGDPALSRDRAAAALSSPYAEEPCGRDREPSPSPPTLPVAREPEMWSTPLPSAPSKPPLCFRSHNNVENDAEDGDRHQYRIKNLDDGTEFEVKEFREDGMWNKVREVGTGRQLTMEEFEMCVGRSPIVQELMRRQNVEDSSSGSGGGTDPAGDSKPRSVPSGGGRPKKKGNNWLRSIKHMAGNVVAGRHHHSRRHSRSGDEKDTSSEKGGRRLSSATDDSLDGSRPPQSGPERIRIRQYGKSYKDLTGVFMSQEIQAHGGSIWSIKFSLDGRYLASAGDDCVIHVWEVSESEQKGEVLGEWAVGENGSCYPFLAAIGNGSPEMALPPSCIEGAYGDKKRRAKVPSSRKSVNSDHLIVPEHIFMFAEKPFCSFRGHGDDVLDLSWSKSQYLLSSSMDKTVRLWHISSSTCLKTFTHSDYVTCIQFNPVDDRFFISGSLDEKVRIWSIPDRQVVDWNDLHEMVTAACYTPDGKGALVGSHKGSCHLFDTSENKLHYKSQLNLRIKKKKSSHKKITGFQFAPGSSSEVLITSADSRIRVVNGAELVHKFKGFRNTSSQISASLAPNGKYVICASEDSHVYIWRYDDNSQPSKTKGVVNVTHSYEHFHCQGVTVAVTWPGIGNGGLLRAQSSSRNDPGGAAKADQEALLENSESPSATWPEEKLLANKCGSQSSPELSGEAAEMQRRSAWGMVIVTAGRGGGIRVFQNFGFQVHV